REERLPVDEAARLAAGIAQGLEHAHQSRIIHRDLKPENILLAPDGTPKVADFGLAKGIGEQQTLVTAADRVFGTPGYIAPELLVGKPAGIAADIYALGAILFEMLAGKKAFMDEDAQGVLRRQLAGRTHSLAEARADTPAELQQLIGDCIALDPIARPGSAAEVAERLELFVVPRPDTARLPRALRSGMDSSGAATAVVSKRSLKAVKSVRLPATPTMAASRLQGWRWQPAALVGVCLSLALGAAAWRTWRRPAETSRTQPAASLSTAAPAAALPAVREVTVSGSQAHVWLSKPASVEMTLKYFANIAKVRTHVVAAGARDFMLENLESGVAYEGSLTAGSAIVPLRFRTRIFDNKRGVHFLLLPEGKTLEVALTRSGDRVGAAILRQHGEEHQEAIALQSLDRGLTWSQPVQLTGKVSTASEISIACAGESVIACVQCEEPGQKRETRLFRKRWEDAIWTVLGSVESLGATCPVVATAPGSGFFLVYLESGSFRARRMPDAVFGQAPPIAHGWEIQNLTQAVVWREETLEVFTNLWGWAGIKGDRILWSWIPLKTSTNSMGPWAPMTPLEVGNGRAIGLSTAATARRLVMAFEDHEKGVAWRQNLDGKSFVPLGHLKIPPEHGANLPALAGRGDVMYLAYQEFDQTLSMRMPYQRIVVLQMSDRSETWEEVARLPLFADDLKTIRLLAFDDHLLELHTDRAVGALLSVLPFRAGRPTGQTSPPFQRPQRP
ncbi:MAG: serine/threonine protein kinase, partial [Candidatus Wallbacteria bacterium]|nr:serine/threonine protein kinase [Candidatus Wallbacteria bacterium]